VQEIDLLDFIAGQVQEIALRDGDDLQMGLEQRKIPRPQCGQETIASMLVLIWSHADFHHRCRLPAVYLLLPAFIARCGRGLIEVGKPWGCNIRFAPYPGCSCRGLIEGHKDRLRRLWA
jgi:hypothetical protein